MRNKLANHVLSLVLARMAALALAGLISITVCLVCIIWNYDLFVFSQMFDVQWNLPKWTRLPGHREGLKIRICTEKLKSAPDMPPF
jgi:uncharacterized membrane protein